MLPLISKIETPDENIYVDRLINDCVARCGGEKYAELVVILGALRSLAMVHQTHHWQSHGPNSYSDHLLFERLYTETSDEVDGMAEKIAGLSSISLLALSKHVITLTGFLGALKEGGTSDSLHRKSLDAEKLLVSLVETVMARLEAKGSLTRGLENLLGGIADKHEGHIFLLKTRSL